MKSRGIGLPEIIISIAIVMVISTIGTTVFFNTKKSAELTSSTDGIVTSLEQARSNAISGKGGSNYGVKFATSTYTFFTGTTYVSTSTSNIVYKITDGYTISAVIGGTASSVTFYRLTGLPSATGTITVNQVSPTKTQVITVGSQGNVTVQK